MTQARPKSQRAVIYNQDDLYDFANSGGSVGALLEAELKEGNRFVIVQQPTGGRPVVLMMLERPEDISIWEDYREKMRDWRRNILGQLPIEKKAPPAAIPHAQGALQIQSGSPVQKQPSALKVTYARRSPKTKSLNPKSDP